MPNHLTRHLSAEAQALAERLATEGPLAIGDLTDAESFVSHALITAGVAHRINVSLALTLAGAEAHRAPGTDATALERTRADHAERIRADARTDAERLASTVDALERKIGVLQRGAATPTYLATLAEELPAAELRGAEQRLRSLADSLCTLRRAANPRAVG